MSKVMNTKHKTDGAWIPKVSVIRLCGITVTNGCCVQKSHGYYAN